MSLVASRDRPLNDTAPRPAAAVRLDAVTLVRRGLLLLDSCSLQVKAGEVLGGMRQRVAIARALACDAGTVLVDEPFASVDAETAGRLRELLRRELTALGRPTIWVTHSATEAAAVADHVLCMSGPPSGAGQHQLVTGDELSCADPLPDNRSADRSTNRSTDGSTLRCTDPSTIKERRSS